MLYQCIVIGAGASGLFFAATRKNSGPILLLDNQARPGRKLLLSGGGKCNVTNRNISPANYISANPQFCRQALTAFSPKHMLDFLKRHNIALEEREHGQMFCKRGAEELRDLLLNLAHGNNADLHLGRNIRAIRYTVPQPHARDNGYARGNSSTSDARDNRTNSDACAHHNTSSTHAGQNTEGMYPTRSIGGIHVESCPSLPQNAAFQIITDNNEYLGRNLLIAAGGPAWPKAGASHFGQRMAAAFGHSILPPAPALTPLKMPPEWPLHGLQGLSLTVTISLAVMSGFNATPNTASTPKLAATPSHGTMPNHVAAPGPGAKSHTAVAPDCGVLTHRATSPSAAAAHNLADPAAQANRPSFTLPLLFTHSGISGPACLQISSYLEPGDAINIDFLPGQDFTALLDAPENARSSPLQLLRKLLPPRLAAALLPPDLRDRKCAEISRANRNALHQAAHAHRVTPLAPSFAQAESSRGGIDTTQISPTTMQSQLLPNLYITGEALDICGQLGGYNLHWAWASAWCAGRVV